MKRRLATPSKAGMLPAMSLVTSLVMILGLAACGQKGPLYLPGDPSEIRTEIPSQPAEPGAQQDDPSAAPPGEEIPDDEDR